MKECSANGGGWSSQVVQGVNEMAQVPIGIIVFDELELIIFVSQGLTLVFFYSYMHLIIGQFIILSSSQELSQCLFIQYMVYK